METHKSKDDSSKIQSIRRSTASSSKTLSNIETFTCFWLDQDISKTKDRQEIQKELRKMITSLKIFESANECEQLIRNTTKEKIILISSNILAQQILPSIHDLSQFRTCYIYCSDQTINKQWITKYSKVRVNY